MLQYVIHGGPTAEELVRAKKASTSVTFRLQGGLTCTLDITDVTLKGAAGTELVFRGDFLRQGRRFEFKGTYQPAPQSGTLTSLGYCLDCESYLTIYGHCMQCSKPHAMQAADK